MKKKRIKKFQKTGIISDYEKQLYNQPREQTALRDGTQSKFKNEKTNYEESNFVRLSKNKRERKMQKRIREKNQIGEKLDDFTELNDIKNYFEETVDQSKKSNKQMKGNKSGKSKKIWKGKKLKKFRKK